MHLFLPLRLSKSSSFVMSKSSSNVLTVASIEVEFVTKSSSLFLPLRLSKSSSFVMSKSSSKENCMISLCRLGLPFLSHFAFHIRVPRLTELRLRGYDTRRTRYHTPVQTTTRLVREAYKLGRP